MSEYAHIPSSDDDTSSRKDDRTESGNLIENRQGHRTDQLPIWLDGKTKALLYAVISAFIFLLALNVVLATSLHLNTRDVGNRYGKSHRMFPYEIQYCHH